MTTVEILRLASGGDGVGRLADGRTVFVPRTAPGDHVELTGIRAHGRYARGRLARLERPGPSRVTPRCAHYVQDECGGCQLQHLDPETQLAAKRAFVADTLRRIGHLEVDVAPVISGGPAWEYRTRITLAVGPGRRFAGYHRVAEPGRLFALERCLIATPAVQALWTGLRSLLHLLPEDTEQLVLRVDREGGSHLVVRARGARAWTEAEVLRERLAEHGVTARVWWHPDGGAPRIVAGPREAAPASIFEQVHPALGDRIRAHAVAQLGPLSGVHAWDLYGGSGETTALLLSAGATVESVELDARAGEWARRMIPASAPRWRHHVGRVEELVERLDPAGAVVLNPPRAGADPRVVAALCRRRPSRVVYVSCDPATLARDLGQLAGVADGRPYRVLSVQPFDLFPQTAHVETVAVLEDACATT